MWHFRSQQLRLRLRYLPQVQLTRAAKSYGEARAPYHQPSGHSAPASRVGDPPREATTLRQLPLWHLANTAWPPQRRHRGQPCEQPIQRDDSARVARVAQLGPCSLRGPSIRVHAPEHGGVLISFIVRQRQQHQRHDPHPGKSYMRTIAPSVSADGSRTARFITRVCLARSRRSGWFDRMGSTSTADTPRARPSDDPRTTLSIATGRSCVHAVYATIADATCPEG